MKNRILLKTNLAVCLIIVTGFLLTILLSYQINYGESMKNIEQVSNLTSEGIFYQMSNLLDKPVNVSLTMANDSLLHRFLAEETDRLSDAGYTDTLCEYLRGYQEKYGYDAVFLVSSATARYYNFNGLDRVLNPDDPENAWYYQGVLTAGTDYSMNVDNDEVAGAQNAITLFVNCLVRSSEGELLGVVGVGLRIDQLQKTLQSYQDQFGINAYFADEEGIVQLSAGYTGYDRISLFAVEAGSTGEARQTILNNRSIGEPLSFWDVDSAGQRKNYIVTRYLPDLRWHLVVERDTAELIVELTRRLIVSMLIIGIIITLILLVITHVIRSFNRRIISLTQVNEQERKTLFEKATELLFENIYEIDITHNRPANQVTEAYFARLGSPPGTPFDKSLRIVAQKQLKPEFRQGYLDAFLPGNVLKAYAKGQETLRYEFMISTDGSDYYWMRITALLVWEDNSQSLHMLVYRQNIDAEKRQEQRMLSLAQTDEMTGLLNKGAAQRAFEKALAAKPDGSYALYVFDIDRFKDANDLYGHLFGDDVIRVFAAILREHFDSDALLGRIGGDEFAALMPVADAAMAMAKARELSKALSREHVKDQCSWRMSSSIGVALAPRDGNDFDTLYRNADAALYEVKKCQRGACVLYADEGGPVGLA